MALGQLNTVNTNVTVFHADYADGGTDNGDGDNDDGGGGDRGD